MNLKRYEPSNLFSQLQNEVNKLFDNRLGIFGGEDFPSIVTSEWAPSVDIKEEADRFVVKADLPGVASKDIDVSMENGMLTIKGERKTETKDEREGYKRTERSYGSFYRRFSLPNTANADKITAKLKDGVLEVVIPKKEGVQPRKISVEG